MEAKLTEKNERIILCFFCTFVGGIIRILYCIRYSVPARDSFKYAEYIKVWDTTGSIPTGSGTPPLLLYLTKTLHDLIGYNIIKCGIVINVLCGLFLIMIAMKIVWRVTGLNILALSAGLLVATSPTLVDYSCQFLRESSFLAFTFLAMLYTVEYIKKKETIYIFSMAMYSSFAFLARYEALEYIAVACFVILTIQTSMKNKIQRLGIYCITFICVIIAFSLIANIPFSYYKDYSEKIQEKISLN